MPKPHADAFEALSERGKQMVASLPIAYVDATISLSDEDMERFHWNPWNELTLKKGKERDLYLGKVLFNEKVHISEWTIHLRIAVLTPTVLKKLRAAIEFQNDLTVRQIESYIKDTDEYVGEFE
jgi:hypothetical protein